MSTLILNIFFDVEMTMDVETVHPRLIIFFVGGKKNVLLFLVWINYTGSETIWEYGLNSKRMSWLFLIVQELLI